MARMKQDYGYQAIEPAKDQRGYEDFRVARWKRIESQSRLSFVFPNRWVSIRFLPQGTGHGLQDTGYRAPDSKSLVVDDLHDLWFGNRH